MMETHALRLRELTENYYHGLMEWEAYRAARGALLDTLLTETDVELVWDEDLSTARKRAWKHHQTAVGSPTPVDLRSNATPTGAGETSSPASATSTHTGSGLRRGLPWVGGGAVAVLVGVLAWLLVPGDNSPPAPEPATTSEVADTELLPAESVIETFLAHGTWDEEAVSRLLFEWDSIDPEHHREVRQTEAFRRFVAEVRRRIMVDRAVDAPVFRNGLSLSEALAVELDLGLVTERILKPGEGLADQPLEVEALESEQPCAVERLSFRSATCWDMLTEDVRAPVMRVVPSGTFMMGDPDDESASPVRELRIERPFAIGMFEISHGEFERFCRGSDRQCPEPRWSSKEHPVVGVTWGDAQAYVEWLSAETGATYRLPTEVEWEYAARAGESSRYPFGDEIAPAFARYDSGMGNGGALPLTDRTTRRNPYRLLHMAGNVRELTADAWRENYAAPVTQQHVAVRGGSYADPPDRLRCAAREGIPRTHADAQTGFRIVRDLP